MITDTQSSERERISTIATGQFRCVVGTTHGRLLGRSSTLLLPLPGVDGTRIAYPRGLPWPDCLRHHEDICQMLEDAGEKTWEFEDALARIRAWMPMLWTISEVNLATTTYIDF